jgi:hypothetical protein
MHGQLGCPPESGNLWLPTLIPGFGSQKVRLISTSETHTLSMGG